MSQAEENHSEMLWQHVKTGHRKTKPWDSYEDFRESFLVDFPEEPEEKIQFDWVIEIERWHNDHHEEHQDFMMHIQSPYSHTN